MPQVLAHHLILTSYGHWLPNDLRGSNSETLRQPKLAPIAPLHHGRKQVQPTRPALKQFHHHATPLLDFLPIWFNTETRETIAAAFATAITQRRYTVYACAIVRNHAHLLIRRHRDPADAIWQTLADTARLHLDDVVLIPHAHPLWADRPWTKFKYSPTSIRACIAYINNNPEKENLLPQHWPFITPYNNWPFHKSPEK
jgi:hypothetical protein